MKTLLSLVAVTMMLSIVFGVEAFAQETYDVNIPTGAASPDAPYFWQSEKDGSTTGAIEILKGDTIHWKNADTTFHDVTSGSAEEGQNGIFSSAPMGPGKSFSHKFTEIGDYPYYCTLHPWMEGTVIVTAGYSLIPNVGKEAGDGSTYFDVEYDFNRVLSTASINEDQKSITFEIIGEAKSENHELELRLDPALIDGPFVIWVDNEKTEFEQVREDNLNVLYIPLSEDSELLTISGTSVVPEFGSLAMLILVISVVSVIVLGQRTKMRF